MAHLQTIYSHQLTVIHHERIISSPQSKSAYINLEVIKEFDIREKQTMDFVNEKIGQYWKAKIEEVSA